MRRSERHIAITVIMVAIVAIGLFWVAGESGEAGGTGDNPATKPLGAQNGGGGGAPGSLAPGGGYGRGGAYASGSSAPNGFAAGSGGARYYATEAARKAERFPFDPNTADSSQLLRLGLQPWQVRNIYKYRAHGGIYRTKKDFADTYGMTVKQYHELEPYITISKDYRPASTLFAKETHERDTLRYPVKLNVGEQVELNTLDTLQLRKVPGIGSYFAREIVRHGQRLGGYYTVDQLDEIDGFPQTAKKYFSVNTTSVHKLNINKLSLQQLRRHPYINYYQAKAIADYRRLHGNIKSMADLRFCKDFTEAAISRLQYYVEY